MDRAVSSTNLNVASVADFFFFKRREKQEKDKYFILAGEHYCGN